MPVGFLRSFLGIITLLDRNFDYRHDVAYFGRKLHDESLLGGARCTVDHERMYERSLQHLDLGRRERRQLVSHINNRVPFTTTMH